MVNTSRVSNLLQRARMLAEARAFFASRQILEVDCPALSKGAHIDAHIDLLTVALPGGEKRFLHTSPEYRMKCLLAEGIGDIYQLGHVFREGEIGPLHNPEFTMAEWYRVGMAYSDFIEETLTFIRIFLGELPATYLTYQKAFISYANIDPFQAEITDLLACAKTHALHLPLDSECWDKDTLLQALMSFIIEPHLGKDSLVVIDGYPASQAALAKTEGDVAQRFEIYYRGVELANGYHELSDPQEQGRRFIEGNAHRQRLGKDPLLVDEYFLAALEKGLPDCCGVAVGFDRLLLLQLGASHLSEILPFVWTEC